METHRLREELDSAHAGGTVLRLRTSALSGRFDIDPPRTELDSLDDHRLVLLCLAGDEGAWESLVSRYRRLIYAIALRSGLDKNDADDVFLEVFARLLEHLDQMRRPSLVRSWLMTTSRRLSLDLIIRQKRLVPLPDPTAELEDPHESVLEEISDAGDRDLVHRALDRLGVECQRLLDLLYGLSSGRGRRYREVAEDLGLAIGSVGPSRARCLDSLRVEMRRLELGRPGPSPRKRGET